MINAFFRITFIFSLFAFVSCTQKYYTPYEYQGAQLIIGTGGGYTGQVIEYTLLDNGQVFGGTNKEGKVTMTPKLNKKTTKQLFSNYEMLDFRQLQVDKPGNMYHYLIYKNEETNHKLQWGAYDAEAPRELLIYFANLKKILSSAVKSETAESSNK